MYNRPPLDYTGQNFVPVSWAPVYGPPVRSGMLYQGQPIFTGQMYHGNTPATHMPMNRMAHQQTRPLQPSQIPLNSMARPMSPSSLNPMPIPVNSMARPMSPPVSPSLNPMANPLASTVPPMAPPVSSVNNLMGNTQLKPRLDPSTPPFTLTPPRPAPGTDHQTTSSLPATSQDSDEEMKKRIVLFFESLSNLHGGLDESRLQSAYSTLEVSMQLFISKHGGIKALLLSSEKFVEDSSRRFVYRKMSNAVSIVDPKTNTEVAIRTPSREKLSHALPIIDPSTLKPKSPLKGESDNSKDESDNVSEDAPREAAAEPDVVPFNSEIYEVTKQVFIPARQSCSHTSEMIEDTDTSDYVECSPGSVPEESFANSMQKNYAPLVIPVESDSKSAPENSKTPADLAAFFKSKGITLQFDKKAQTNSSTDDEEEETSTDESADSAQRSHAETGQSVEHVLSLAKAHEIVTCVPEDTTGNSSTLLENSVSNSLVCEQAGGPSPQVDITNTSPKLVDHISPLSTPDSILLLPRQTLVSGSSYCSPESTDLDLMSKAEIKAETKPIQLDAKTQTDVDHNHQTQNLELQLALCELQLEVRRFVATSALRESRHELESTVRRINEESLRVKSQFSEKRQLTGRLRTAGISSIRAILPGVHNLKEEVFDPTKYAKELSREAETMDDEPTVQLPRHHVKTVHPNADVLLQPQPSTHVLRHPHTLLSSSLPYSAGYEALRQPTQSPSTDTGSAQAPIDASLLAQQTSPAFFEQTTAKKSPIVHSKSPNIKTSPGLYTQSGMLRTIVSQPPVPQTTAEAPEVQPPHPTTQAVQPPLPAQTLQAPLFQVQTVQPPHPPAQTVQPPLSTQALQASLSQVQTVQPPLLPAQTVQPPLSTQALQAPLSQVQTVQPPLLPTQTVQPPLSTQALQAPLSQVQTVQPPLPPAQTVQPPLPPAQTVQPPFPPAQTVQPPLSEQTLQASFSQVQSVQTPLPPARTVEPALSAAQAVQTPTAQTVQEAPRSNANCTKEQLKRVQNWLSDIPGAGDAVGVPPIDVPHAPAHATEPSAIASGSELLKQAEQLALANAELIAANPILAEQMKAIQQNCRKLLQPNAASADIDLPPGLVIPVTKEQRVDSLTKAMRALGLEKRQESQSLSSGSASQERTTVDSSASKAGKKKLGRGRGRGKNQWEL